MTTTNSSLRYLISVLTTVAAVGCAPTPAVRHADVATPAVSVSPLMNLCEPKDASWDKPVPQPVIPPPPTGKGLTNPAALRVVPQPLFFKGDAELAAAAARPDGWVTGDGTPEKPWRIANLAFDGITDKTAIRVDFAKRPLIIENCRVTGRPVDAYAPAPAFGIEIIDSQGVRIRNCEVSKCVGIYGGGSALVDLRIENCLVVSTVNGIMTSGGHHCAAVGNFVRDATKYGVFLYNGTDHTIDGNYVMWAGREGIGTNGKSQRARYVNNVILHNGWTAINVEGDTDDTLVEGNLVVDSHYGIILMGNRVQCRRNQVFYSSQEGVYIHSADSEGQRVTGMVIEDNLIVGSGVNGVWVTAGAQNTLVKNNRIRQCNNGILLTAPGGVAEDNDISRFFFGISATGYPATIRNNRLYSGRNGIKAEDIAAPGLLVEGNRLHHSIYGVVASKLAGGTFARNRMDSVGQVLSFEECKDLVLRENEACQIGYTGVTLGKCTGCQVEGNRLIGGVTEAIRLAKGGKHTITGNEIANIRSEFDAGGLVLQETRDNRIANNQFRSNGVAIVFWGPDSEGNDLTGNRYAGNGKDLIVQKGGTIEAATGKNRLDTTAVPR